MHKQFLTWVWILFLTRKNTVLAEETSTAVHIFATNSTTESYTEPDYILTEVVTDGNINSNDSNDYDAGYDGLLEFMQQSMITYGEDLAMDCMDEADVQLLVNKEVKNMKEEIQMIFNLSIALFVSTLVILLITVIYFCRRSPSCSSCIRTSTEGESNDEESHKPIRDNATYSELTLPRSFASSPTTSNYQTHNV
ncbi:beta-1,3-glucuronosyltransferase [Ciona intestinalis]